jgi:hypothetical protein
MTFTPRSQLVWSLGPWEAPELSLNGTDDDGIEWTCERPVGWDALAPDLPVEEGADDGGWFGPGRWPTRVLTLRGAFRRIRVGADLDAAEDRLRNAVERVTADQLLTVSEPVPKQVTVRQSGACEVLPVTNSPRVRTFSVVLTAADPRKYLAGSAGLLRVPLALAPPVFEGLSFPAEFPASFGSVPVTLNRQVVTNPGRVRSAARLTISGPPLVAGAPAPPPVTGPQVANATTGEYFGLDTLAAGSTAVIDCGARTVRIDGVSRLSARARGSRWLGLVRGPNDLRFLAEDYAAGAVATVEFRPAWR